MKKYIIDTNVLYGILLNDGRCDLNNTLGIISKSKGIVTYATLFEVFDFKRFTNQYKDKKTFIHAIMNFFNDYKIDVAGINEQDEDMFWELVYSAELSDDEVVILEKLLITQTCKYISRVLGQIMNAFAFLYAKMKLNKEDDAYNAYVLCSSYVMDNFSHFPFLVAEIFEKVLTCSYMEEVPNKVSGIIQKEFWGIVREIEVHHSVLTGKSSEYIEENDFSLELEQKKNEFDIQYKEKDYLSFIKKAYEQMKDGKTLFLCDDFFSNFDCQFLGSVEKDFLFSCLRKMLFEQGKFKYNDIIDFINFSTAFYYADGIMTLDKPLLNLISTFSCIEDSDFCEISMRIHDFILE